MVPTTHTVTRALCSQQSDTKLQFWHQSDTLTSQPLCNIQLQQKVLQWRRFNWSGSNLLFPPQGKKKNCFFRVPTPFLNIISQGIFSCYGETGKLSHHTLIYILTFYSCNLHKCTQCTIIYINMAYGSLAKGLAYVTSLFYTFSLGLGAGGLKAETTFVLRHRAYRSNRVTFIPRLILVI